MYFVEEAHYVAQLSVCSTTIIIMFNIFNNSNNPNMQEVLASFEQQIKRLNEKVSTFEDEITFLKTEYYKLNPKEIEQLRTVIGNIGNIGATSPKSHQSLQNVERNDFKGKK
jgi:predicted nuclease with TOPRIM domain